jgi:hypothetical protein
MCNANVLCQWCNTCNTDTADNVLHACKLANPKWYHANISRCWEELEHGLNLHTWEAQTDEQQNTARTKRAEHKNNFPRAQRKPRAPKDICPCRPPLGDPSCDIVPAGPPSQDIMFGRPPSQDIGLGGSHQGIPSHKAPTMMRYRQWVGASCDMAAVN